jgi:hypothetical protein
MNNLLLPHIVYLHSFGKVCLDEDGGTHLKIGKLC